MKFYTNDLPLEIIPSGQKTPPNAYVLGSASVEHIFQHYQMACDGQIKGSRHMVFVVKDYNGTVEQLKQKFKVMHAAGGIVSKGELKLFIHRIGKWDLPKGKVEKGEGLNEAAVREVEEECGVQVTLQQKVGETWHTFKQKGKDILKCTHWYTMTNTDDSAMTPQTEEDIAEVRWMTPKEVTEIALADTYKTIQEIFEQAEQLSRRAE